MFQKRFFILVTQIANGKKAGLIARLLANSAKTHPWEFDFAQFNLNDANRWNTEAEAASWIDLARKVIDERHPDCVGTYTLEVAPIDEVNGVICWPRKR